MATSFIRISSEAGWPDDPIKRPVWLRAVWANTWTLLFFNSVFVSLSMCEYQWVFVSVLWFIAKVPWCKELKVSQSPWKKKAELIFFDVLHILYVLSHNYTIVYLGIGDEWHSLYWFLVGIVLAEVEKTLVWSRPNARVFKVGWFWASQDPSHNDHISVWAQPWWTCYSKGLLRGGEHASTDPVREKKGTLHSLATCDVSLRWNSSRSCFWSQYLDWSRHLVACRRLSSKSGGTL